MSRPHLHPHPLALRCYRAAMIFYPARLRAAYRDQMLQTLNDAYQDRTVNPPTFWFNFYLELLQSSVREHMLMLRDNFFERPLVFHTAIMAIVLSVVGAGIALTVDQMLRRGADQPQIDMTEWYAGEIAAGEAPANAIPPGYVDLERSLQPAVIFYDDQGRPTGGTGYLDQKLPAPPSGVFNFVRDHGVEKLTWQPRQGVRLATVIRRVSGKNAGFILAGRSLRVVEEQKSMLHGLALILWLVVMTLLFAGAYFLNRAQLAKRTAA